MVLNNNQEKEQPNKKVRYTPTKLYLQNYKIGIAQCDVERSNLDHAQLMSFKEILCFVN